jgi:hypothetical protein
MQKAHLYEAILLVNRGVDEAVRGLERLKRAKGSKLDPSSFDEELVLFEDHRAAQFLFLQHTPAHRAAGLGSI